jgi:ABC-type transport system involved in cytochrome bd biosynthesis fused ATPase/permease subunit
VRTILPKQSRYDWSALDTTFARIHATVRREIEKKRDGDRLRVIRHNIGFMLLLYLKIVAVIWVAGMVYVALT